MKSKRHYDNTSTALFGRNPCVAPIERARKKGMSWRVSDESGFSVEIDDALTESDIDLLEWLVVHGNPQRLRDGRTAFRFSLYAAARDLHCGRWRLKNRIERRMKTLIKIQDGTWRITAQIFGPTIQSIAAGTYVVTWTAEFARLFERGLLVFYSDLVDDILPIASPVVRRLVRRTLTHDRWGPESIEHALDDIRCAAGATMSDSRRRIYEQATRDIIAAGDYLAAVFGIQLVDLADGRPAIYYVRERGDGRIWIQHSRDRRPGLSGPVARTLGACGRTLGACGPDSRGLRNKYS